jgi:hypothetical protein
MLARVAAGMPCRKRHWHGASLSTAMSHLGITQMIDCKNVEWMKPVTDLQYEGWLLITGQSQRRVASSVLAQFAGASEEQATVGA